MVDFLVLLLEREAEGAKGVGSSTIAVAMKIIDRFGNEIKCATWKTIQFFWRETQPILHLQMKPDRGMWATRVTTILRM